MRYFTSLTTTYTTRAAQSFDAVNRLNWTVVRVDSFLISTPPLRRAGAQTYRDAAPHDGYAALLDVAASRPAGYFVLTTNVDGLFAKAQSSALATFSVRA